MNACWITPSNIALVKYWGKKAKQIPCNSSLSLTLNKCCTKTRVETLDNISDSHKSLEFTFAGEENPSYEARIEKTLQLWQQLCPKALQYRLRISSENTFPAGAGIASSASSMAALALCLWTIEKRLAGDTSEFLEKDFETCSEMARLASGSASRSLYGGLVAWDVSQPFSAHPVLSKSKMDAYGFELNDLICLVDSGEKKVSSSEGHELMNSHPFAQLRYERAEGKFQQMKSLFTNQNSPTGTAEWSDLGLLIEQEALELHALAMSSSPSVIYFRADTISCIEAVQRFRHQFGPKAFFTLDAGPNLHVLYLIKDKELIRKELYPRLCMILDSDDAFIWDNMGTGPRQCQ